MLPPATSYTGRRKPGTELSPTAKVKAINSLQFIPKWSGRWQTKASLLAVSGSEGEENQMDTGGGLITQLGISLMGKVSWGCLGGV